MSIWPSYKYHKKLGAKVFNSKEEFEKAGSGWKNSPADFEEKTPVGATNENADPTGEKEEKSKESSAMNLDEMSVEELVKIAIEKGIAKKEAKSLDKDQLLELLKG